MTRANDSAISATTRPLAMRRRPDLVVRPQQVGLRRFWVVKDPLALSYFHLRDEEHAILEMLDGWTSVGEIKRRFERDFAPQQVTVEQIQAFLAQLHESGLLVADAPGQGERLLARHRRQRGRKLLGALTSILAIRLLSFDAEPVLRWLYPKVRWMFSPWILAGGVLSVVAAAALVVVKFDTLWAELPDFRAFFQARNVLWLAVALALTKLLHELGHGLTCKHFRGECHELGVMLLVFTPCLYCDVSDAWMLPGKWQRIAIGAAGMCVEIVLAATCTFLWWFSEPGLLHLLCLNTVFVCSVSTLLFNGNPLLRYDGYFILSDLVEVPNLAQQSRALVRRGLARLALGLDLHNERALPERRRGLLAAYAVASTLYRWVVVVAILWFVYQVVKPYRMELLAHAMAVFVFAGLVATPAVQATAFLRDPTRNRHIKPVRALVSLGLLGAMVTGALIVPLPYRVAAPVVLEPLEASHVYVSVPGTLVSAVEVGATVERGQTLAELEDLDLRLKVERLAGQCDQQRLHLENLRYRLLQDPSVGPQVPAAQEALADLEERLRARQRDLGQLAVGAPVAGTVLPPPGIAAGQDRSGQLAAWSGSPLDRRNSGCLIETGTLLCLVGDPSRLEAVLYIDQADLPFVRTGQRVRMRLDETPGETLGGTIVEIARTDLKVVPRELATGGGLAVRVGDDGVPLPLETSYQARVALDDHDGLLRIGAGGRAKIVADPQPLVARLARYLRQTVRFRL